MKLYCKTTTEDDIITFYYDENGHEILHSENDIPAFILIEGDKFWYEHGKMHRLTAPAHIDDNKVESWYYKGEWFGSSDEGYNQEKFEKEIKLLVFS